MAVATDRDKWVTRASLARKGYPTTHPPSRTSVAPMASSRTLKGASPVVAIGVRLWSPGREQRHPPGPPPRSWEPAIIGAPIVRPVRVPSRPIV